MIKEFSRILYFAYSPFIIGLALFCWTSTNLAQSQSLANITLPPMGGQYLGWDPGSLSHVSCEQNHKSFLGLNQVCTDGLSTSSGKQKSSGVFKSF